MIIGEYFKKPTIYYGAVFYDPDQDRSWLLAKVETASVLVCQETGNALLGITIDWADEDHKEQVFTLKDLLKMGAKSNWEICRKGPPAE